MSYAAGSPRSPEAKRYPPKRKPEITAELLEAHDIEYDPKILDFDAADEASGEKLPPSIDGVREWLLDATTLSVPQGRKDFMEHELSETRKAWNDAEKSSRDSWSLMPPKSAWWNPAYPHPDDDIVKESIDKDINECRKTADEAKNNREAAEPGWTHFLRVHVFRNFRSTTKHLRKHE